MIANHFLAMHEVYFPQQHQQQKQLSQEILSNTASDGESHSDNDKFTNSTDLAIQNSNHDEILSIDGIMFSLPDSDHLIVNDFNVSHAFY